MPMVSIKKSLELVYNYLTNRKEWISTAPSGPGVKSCSEFHKDPYYFKGRKCLRKKVLRFLRFWLESQKFIPAKCCDISELQKFFPTKFSWLSQLQKFSKIFHNYTNHKFFLKKLSFIIRKENSSDRELFLQKFVNSNLKEIGSASCRERV